MSDSDNAPRLQLGDEASESENEEVRRFLLLFTQLLQVTKFHDLENAAVQEPLEAVGALTDQLCRGDRRIHMLLDGEQIFVNRKRVRFSSGGLQKVFEFVEMLEQRGLAGFEVREPMAAPALKAFLRVFHSITREIEDPAAFLEAAMAEEGVGGIGLLKPAGSSHTAAPTMKLAQGQIAALLYAKLVVTLRESLRSWEKEESRRVMGTRIRRIVQQIITLAEKTARPFLWLVHMKDEDEYLYTHSANVALLSILLGQRLGLNRNRLCELGTAALFHDMGKVSLPPGLLAKKGDLSELERRLMGRHPIHGANLLLRAGTLNETLLKRLVVVFEHCIDANGYPRENWPNKLHLFSRIVAIVDAYDAMTTRRSYRPAWTPAETLQKLIRDSGNRYDADLVKVFLDLMGVFPLGTLVMLDTGEAGLVFHVDPTSPTRPLVKLVLDADGNRLDEGEVVDLSETDAAGGYRRAITTTGDPVEHGIHVPAYLMEGAA